MGHTHRYKFGFIKKIGKESQFKVLHPKLGSDPPIGSDRESGSDMPFPLASNQFFAISSKLGLFWSYLYSVQSSLGPSPKSWEMALSLKGTHLPLM